MTPNPPQRRKHVPTRTCVVCRQPFEKRQLRRLVYTADGLLPDPTGRAAGRGAYLCDQAKCWERAAQAPAILGNALRATLTPADVERLRAARP